MTGVDILILGAGWTSTFLIPLLTSSAYNLTYAATSRSGTKGTIKFMFDQDAEDRGREEEEFMKLPDAKTVLVTFPITKEGAISRLVDTYRRTRNGDGEKGNIGWIQLGSTGVWDGVRKSSAASAEGTVSTTSSPTKASHKWFDRHSPLPDPLSARGVSENELLALNSPSTSGNLTTVLNLSGLWGRERQPRRWVWRVAPTKEALKAKGSIHLVHGQDVSRAILAIHANFSKAAGERWILTDGRVYDWWDLVSAWSFSGEETGTHATWVRELTQEENIRALPRNVELLGRALDSRDFWETFGIVPEMGRVV